MLSDWDTVLVVMCLVIILLVTIILNDSPRKLMSVISFTLCTFIVVWLFGAGIFNSAPEVKPLDKKEKIIVKV
jgi:energy-coupling factor transporter transmembrane protein EcfT